MTFHFAWFVLFICVCRAQDDTIEGSGEGSGEEEPLTPEPSQASVIQQITDNNDALDFSITNPAKDGCGVDLVFLLDASGSLEQIYTQHINWTTQLVDALLTSKNQVHIGVIQYAEAPTTEFSLGTYKKPRDITNHIMTINFRSGGTRTGKALVAAEGELFSEEKGARENASKIIILFTDGLSIDDPLKYAQQLREMKNVKIYVVSVGSDGFEPEMNRIAGKKSNVFGPTDYSRLLKSLIGDVEYAQTCPRPAAPQSISEETPIAGPVKTVKTVTKTRTTKTSVPRQTTPTKRVHTTTTRTRTPTTARPTSRKSVVKDMQLKHKNKKFPVEQAAVPQAQVAKIPEKQVQESSKASGNIDEVPIDIVNDDKQLLGDITALEESTASNDVNEDVEEDVSVASLSKPTKKPRKKRPLTTATPSSNNSPVESRKMSSSSGEASSTKTKTRSTTVRISTPTTKRSQKQQTQSGSPGNVARSQGHCPRELLFIVDSSGSVQRIYDQQKEYLLSLLNELQIGEDEQRVALMQFAGVTHQRVEWTFDAYDNARDVAEALAQVRHFTGTTFIGRALENSIGVLETRRQGVPTIVILVSDGFSQDDASKPAEEIRRMPNVDFYAVSMSELNNFEYLAKLTDDPSKVYVGQRSEVLKQDLLKLIHCRT